MGKIQRHIPFIKKNILSKRTGTEPEIEAATADQQILSLVEK